MSFSRFFSQLKRLGYYPDIVVADDRGGLNSALLKVFPYSLLQLCHNHYLENIRTLLKVRSTEKYRQFFFDLKEKVFDDRIDPKKSLRSFSQSSPCFNRLIKNILGTIRYREDVLFNYISVSDCPNNTNLIELYNSHLNGRLKTIKGFQSFDSANRWLNAWIIRRRTKSFTDCEGRFQYLNGHSSFSLSIKKQTPWSDSLTQLGILPIEFFEKNRGKNQLKR